MRAMLNLRKVSVISGEQIEKSNEMKRSKQKNEASVKLRRRIIT